MPKYIVTRSIWLRATKKTLVSLGHRFQIFQRKDECGLKAILSCFQRHEIAME